MLILIKQTKVVTEYSRCVWVTDGCYLLIFYDVCMVFYEEYDVTNAV